MSDIVGIIKEIAENVRDARNYTDVEIGSVTD